MALEGSELVPLKGGDPIPLLRPKLVVGRRESCDICLRFPNISGRHCELSFQVGVSAASHIEARHAQDVPFRSNANAAVIWDA